MAWGSRTTRVPAEETISKKDWPCQMILGCAFSSAGAASAAATTTAKAANMRFIAETPGCW